MFSSFCWFSTYQVYLTENKTFGCDVKLFFYSVKKLLKYNHIQISNTIKIEEWRFKMHRMFAELAVKLTITQGLKRKHVSRFLLARMLHRLP